MRIEGELERIKTERDQLKQWVSDLQSGMYINCVYCGHRYGPDPGTPVAMADVLKQHIEVCPKHPMSTLKRERDALAAALQLVRPYIPESDLVYEDCALHNRSECTCQFCECFCVVTAYEDALAGGSEALTAHDSSLVNPLVEVLKRVRERIGRAIGGWGGERLVWQDEVDLIDRALAPYRREDPQ